MNTCKDRYEEGYICGACNVNFYNNSHLNKHLHECSKYDEWIKTYSPPKTITCNNCNLVFIEKYFITHNCSK